MKEIETHNGLNGGKLEGNSHEKDGIKAVVVTDNNRPVELEGDELIVNKNTALSKKKHVFDGKVKTPVEIISDLNVEGGGVPMFKLGGPIPDTSSLSVKTAYFAAKSEYYKQLRSLKEYNNFAPYEIDKEDLILFYCPYKQKYCLAEKPHVDYAGVIHFNCVETKQKCKIDIVDLLQLSPSLFSKEKKEVLEFLKFQQGGVVLAKQRFSKVREVLRNKITVDPDRFQGRETKYSQDTVNKIVNEGYDKSQEPFVLWYDKKLGKYIVISGHSRWQASTLLYTQGDVSLEKLPAKIFLGTYEEAREYAILESNRSGTEEGIKSDITAFKFAFETGYSRNQLLGIFKPESRLKLLKKLSYLDTKGKFMEILGTPFEKSYPYLERNAAWTGELRRIHGDKLTDAHETELFNFFYSTNKGLKVYRGDLFERIDKKVNTFGYKNTYSLGLDKKKSRKPKSSAHVELHEINKIIDSLNNDFASLREKLINARREGEDTLIKRITKRQRDINKSINLKLEKKQILENQIQKVENTPQPDLFSLFEEEKVDKIKLKAQIIRKHLKKKNWN